MSDDGILVICITIAIVTISLAIGLNTYFEINAKYQSIDKCNQNIECIKAVKGE